MMANVVSDDDWLKARRSLLADEKEFQVARDELAARRRALPWRSLSQDYEFDGENASLTLDDMFGDCSQLMIYHFMFHPDWDEGCKSCSFWADSYDGVESHLRARDVSLAVVSSAPLEKLLAYRERMGWSFPWYSAERNSFNQDFHVSFTREQIDSGKAVYNYEVSNQIGEEMPGISVFRRDGGSIFHTYSTYSRGIDPFNTAYQLLDLTSKGRDEDDLEFTMSWLRRHDEY